MHADNDSGYPFNPRSLADSLLPQLLTVLWIILPLGFLGINLKRIFFDILKQLCLKQYIS